MRFILFTGALLALACTANGLNILGIFPYDGRTHFIVFRELLHELAKRGHNVTVVTHFPDNENDTPPNYRQVSLYIPPKIIYTPEDTVRMARTYSNIFEVIFYLDENAKKNCRTLLLKKEVRDLTKRKFDVVLTDEFQSDCALGLAYKTGAPVVRLTSHVLLPWHYARLGIPYNPAYVPFHFLEGGNSPTLRQRVERVLFHALFNFMYYAFTQPGEQRILAQYFDDIPPLEELARNINFLLVGHHFTLTGSRIFPANVIEVGGYHVKKRPLTGELKKFVDRADKGIVYISFGTTVRVSNLTVDQANAVIDAMDEMPYHFIWRWDKYVNFNHPPFSLLTRKRLAVLNDKKKFFTGSWLPQTDILGHPKVLGFVSHGGFGGATEAIHYGVPLLVTPVSGDQPANAESIEENGFGIKLPVSEITKETLVAGMKKILEPGFRAQAKRMSKAWHDRPMSAMDTAIFWIEYAARNPDLNFRTKAADVPLYQYLNLDIAFVFLMFGALVILFIKIVMWFINNSKYNNMLGNMKKHQ